MQIAIGGVFDAASAAALREKAAGLSFQDGSATAGAFARAVKDNQQAQRSAERDALLARVRETLLSNPVFIAAARPRRFASLLISRYSEGQSYGLHVDDALMGDARTDVSFTLFLSPLDNYEGGALVIEDALEARSVKLEAGEAFLYPSTTLHRVEPVTKGERIAVVGWVTSWVRDPAKREILFDLDQSIAEIHEAEGGSALRDRLAKTRSNLLRLWAEG